MTWRGKRVLVTGGAGFLGSNLVDALVKFGATVTALDSLHSGGIANLDDARSKIVFREADVRDWEAVRNATRGQDVVFHLAANADVPYSLEHPQFDFDVNVLGSQNVMRACMANDVGRLVFASTAAVYGDPVYTPMDEDHPLKPISPYGASKLAAENLGFAYHRTYGLPFTAISISNSYAERQAKYVIHDFLAKLLNDPGKLEVLGDGNQRRDFCHVSDVSRCFLLAAESDATRGEALNLAGAGSISIRELASLVLELLGLEGKTQVSYTSKSWQGDISLLLPDIAKARRASWIQPGSSAEGRRGCFDSMAGGEEGMAAERPQVPLDPLYGDGL